MISDWKERKLGDVLTLKRGYDLPTRERSEDGDIPVVSSSGITGFHDEAKVKAPGVVTGRYGTLGEVFYLKEDFWPLNTTLYVTDFKGNNPLFLSYFLRTLNFERQNAAGAVPGVNRNHLHRMKVRIPPPDVQRQIAGILSAYDDLIENNTRRIEILEEMAQAIYLEWFVHFRFPGHEDVEIVESELGPVPAGWEIVELGEIADQIRRNVDPTELDPKTPYFGLGHLPKKSIALSEWGAAEDVKSTKLAFNRGEILFGKIRPYFHKVGVAPVDGICSTDTIVIVPKDPKYFAVVLGCASSEEFVNFATKTSQGTKMPRAKWKVINEFAVPISPEPLLSRFNRLITDTVDLIHNMIFRNKNLSETRDLLLPRLVSGEIEASMLDPLQLETDGMREMSVAEPVE